MSELGELKTSARSVSTRKYRGIIIKALLPLIVCAGFCAIACGAEASSARKPNIILLLIDDMGYGDISAHGNPVLKTPNFDRLSLESVRFTDFLVSPTCSPTRAALMSGMHELKVGVDHTVSGRNRMDLDAVILPQVMNQAGYSTAIFGKWHLGMEQEEYRPENRGFDLALTLSTEGQRSQYDPVLLRNGNEEKHKGYRTDVLFNDPDCGKTGRAVICKLHRQRLADPDMQGDYGDRSHYEYTEPGKWSLFDLANDPHEDRNIAGIKPEVTERMAKHFDAWWSQFDFGE